MKRLHLTSAAVLLLCSASPVAHSSPDSTVSDIPNRGFAHSESFADGDVAVTPTRAAEPQYPADIRNGQLGAKSTLSERRAAFVSAVAHVRGLITEKKVIWPNARRIVAVVQHANAMRYGSIVQLPRKAMGEHWPITYAIDVHLHPAVTSSVPSAHPQPARCCLLDLTPEAINEGEQGAAWPTDLVPVGARPRAKVASSGRRAIGLAPEHRAALLAGSGKTGARFVPLQHQSLTS